MNFLGKKIGDGEKTFIIAEAGINHNGSLDMALKMVDVAKECGADAVKFQKRDLDLLYRADVLANPSDESHSLGVYIPTLRACELSPQAHIVLKDHCDAIGIKYLCSPWDLGSLAFLESLGVEGYKIPSACLSDVYLLDAVMKTGKPFIVSTGMHCESELNAILNLTLGCESGLTPDVALMHCVSSYPTANRDVNLGYINVLKKTFHVPVGYSGHERGVPITVAAVAMGANLIERHFTLDRTLPGPDHAASLEPHGLEELVRHIRAVEEALGNKKNVNRGEVVARETLGKVLVWANDYPAGCQATEDCFRAMSPGYGIPAYKARYLFNLGYKLTLAKAVKEGQVVLSDHLDFSNRAGAAVSSAQLPEVGHVL